MRDPNLESAYRTAGYAVVVPGREPFTIRCGERCMPLDLLLAESRATAWAFVTAANPRSVLLDEQVNADRLARLETAIRGRGLTCFPGEGRDDAAAWPPEPSLLVIGVEEADAVELARAFDQYAIVCGTRGGEPRLVWVEDPA